MVKNKIQLTLCRTCVRDNQGEGVFADIETVEKVYRQKLKSGIFGSLASIKLQNCFANCESFHCVQITDHEKGFLLKQISDPEKIESVCEWVKLSKANGTMELNEGLKGHLIETVKVP